MVMKDWSFQLQEFGGQIYMLAFITLDPEAYLEHNTIPRLWEVVIPGLRLLRKYPFLPQSGNFSE